MLIRFFPKLVSHQSILVRSFSAKVSESRELVVEALQGEDKGIIVLGLNRPEGRNSLSKSLVTTLEETLGSLRVDKGVRVCVFRSLVEGVFCAGADLKERLAMPQAEVAMAVSRLRRLMSMVAAVPVPTVAALDGAALGGGLELALACDLRVASARARLGLVETRLAIIPGAGGTQRLPRLVGISRAKELIFTGRVLDGPAAADIGLVTRCVPSSQAGDAAYQGALGLAREMLGNGPVALAAAKKAIDAGGLLDLASGLVLEELCYAQVVPTKDRIEGLKAFAEKRKPQYEGR